MSHPSFWCRSLGVVIWELFEFGSQPHRHLSDEEVLTFVIRERQITLAQPRLKLSHADYWSVLLHTPRLTHILKRQGLIVL